MKSLLMTPTASLASLSIASRDQLSLRKLRAFLGAAFTSGLSSTHSAPRLTAGVVGAGAGVITG
jgi:hypothetical protein